MNIAPLTRAMHITRALLMALLVTLLVAPSHIALAASTTVVITEDDIVRQPENTPPTNNWVLYNRNAGTGGFQVGPGDPPAGVGSLGLVTPTGADKVFLFNYDYIGTALSAINSLSYATYRTTGSAQQVTALNIQVDFNGAAAGGFTTLVFEPVYNTAQGAVVDGQWQTWDAIYGGQGRWWSTANINGVCAFDCFVAWETIVAQNPDAVVVGGIGVNQGSGNPTLTAAVDYLTIGASGDTTTYDFEPYEVATTQEQCKDGGWESVTRDDGTGFKNQGDCIQYVNTGK